MARMVTNQKAATAGGSSSRAREPLPFWLSCTLLSWLLAVLAVLAINRALDESVPTNAAAAGDASACPALSFPSGADELGTQWDHAFKAKRHYGAWEASVGLSTIGGDMETPDFRALVPCTWYTGRRGHEFVLLGTGATTGDDDDGIVASIDPDPFSWGWSIEIFDCTGALLAKVEERMDTLMLDLTITAPDGTLLANCEREILSMAPGWTFRNSSGAVVARAVDELVVVGTKEWSLYATSAENGGLDERILAALASYKTWKDKSCGKNCRGDFNGVCGGFLKVVELMLIATLCSVVYICKSGELSRYSIRNTICATGAVAAQPGSTRRAARRAARPSEESSGSPSLAQPQPGPAPTAAAGSMRATLKRHWSNPMNRASFVDSSLRASPVAPSGEPALHAAALTASDEPKHPDRAAADEPRRSSFLGEGLELELCDNV